MKLSGNLICSLFMAALLGAVACSTPTERIGQGNSQLAVGQKYILQRPAILLARRGMIDSIENPNHVIESYKPHRDYDPYDTAPIGVLSAGTLIQVKELRMFRDHEFIATGEVVSGPYKRQVSNAYGDLKRVTVGGRPQTGEVRINELCGGRAFDSKEFTRNLVQAVD